MRFLQYLAAAGLAAAASCGGGGASNSVTGPTGGNPPGGNPTGGSENPVSTNAVTVADNTFTPSSIQVAPGTTVTWTWASGASSHNVTFTDGTRSADRSSGTFTRTFSTAGTFSYTCTLHGGMNGSVLVK